MFVRVIVRSKSNPHPGFSQRVLYTTSPTAEFLLERRVVAVFIASNLRPILYNAGFSDAVCARR